MAYGILTIPMPGQTVGKDDGAVLTEPDRAFGLDEFVVGPENSLVEGAVCAVLEGTPEKFNPLVLCGPSGTGKSHIARGLEGVWRQQHGRRQRVEYTSGMEFARELAEAIKAQATDDFRAKYRKASLLIFDDLGQLEDKQAAQEELIHTLDALLAAGGRFVGTAKALPGELRFLLNGLASRLGMGLTVPLQPPSRQTRFAILCSFAKRRGLPLDESVVEILADGLNLTAPELLGALMQLETSARFDGENIDVGLARRFVDQRSGQNLPLLRDIAAAAAKHFGLRLSDLRGASRRRSVVAARDAAIYLARELMHGSFEEIGRFFGGRDHTTILHGYRKMRKLVVSDAATRQAIEEIRRRWQ